MNTSNLQLENFKFIKHLVSELLLGMLDQNRASIYFTKFITTGSFGPL